MGGYKVEILSFSYPNGTCDVLRDLNFTVGTGEFVCLCGKSGCGKSTLLRLLKSSIAPFGDLRGEIFYDGRPLKQLGEREQASLIGMVMQNPDSQTVTDKVWHELAFGLESLGCGNTEIRTRVAEMASFFGIQNWFHKKTSELSGGQKQLLNLASVMAMQPEVLILDEPTSRLDPIAATEFLRSLKRINDELGTTIIVAEQRMEEVFPLSDRVLVMQDGELIADDTPRNIGRILKEKNNDMYKALPTPMRVFGSVATEGEYPLTIKEGKEWLSEYSEKHGINRDIKQTARKNVSGEKAVELRDIYFKYDKELPYVIKGLNLTVYKGEILSILGGNGSGKSTTANIAAGLKKQQMGRVLINGTDISEIKNLYDGLIGVLPQNPQTLFVRKTVFSELLDLVGKRNEQKIYEVATLCKLEKLLDRHPYDLSGGEQQRAALAMILLKQPQILILDEATKGMDAHFKSVFADILHSLKDKGVTIIMISHDVEFCAAHSDRCAMMFDGGITAIGKPREFFSENCFYTTSAVRMAKKLIPKAIVAEDIINAIGGAEEKIAEEKEYGRKTEQTSPPAEKKAKHSAKRYVCGAVFTMCFLAVMLLSSRETLGGGNYILQALAIMLAGGGTACFLPQRRIETTRIQPINKQRNPRKKLLAVISTLVLIPCTILFGVYFLGDRKYYFISLLVILEVLVPFCALFEKRKPQARELVVISVLCAIAVAGRTAFFALPEFKPVAAVVIISGVCFGGETGFLVGAVASFVSNFIFGQGPWTPWQMFSFGIIGFLAGTVFGGDRTVKTKLSLTAFGFVTVLVLYGGIMNVASVMMSTSAPTLPMIKTALLMGLPVDLIHALSTAFFLWFISEPMIEKLERIKIKYGLIK